MSNIEVFKDWLKKQNAVYKFAGDIKDGTTVYFSDDLAACYDIRIAGLSDDKDSVVIEFESSFTGEDFIDLAGNIWVNKAGWEMWYVDNDFQWMIIVNENGRKKYSNSDLIKSKRINFEFKLEQIKHFTIE